MRLSSLLLLVLLFGCGEVCPEMCAQKARQVERCLGAWDSRWDELGWSGVDDFQSQCDAAWSTDDLSDQEVQELEDRCERELSVSRADLGCDALLLVEP